MIPRPWVVLLAAGASRRFGRPKQLARIGGESLLRRMARVALASDPEGCVVVLGARAERLRRELDGLPVCIVVNHGWRRGLSGSVAAGVGALPAAARAALVLLADQAAIAPAELEHLVATWRRDPGHVVATRLAGRLGPPALFPRALFPSLGRLRGDRGARELLHAHRRRAVVVDLAGAATDIDRPSDLAALRHARAPLGKWRRCPHRGQAPTPH
jgi:CTP:molybdopterin cytidylyltransferase MocA